MRVVIDMQGAQTESRFRGIGRYTMSFTQAVIRNCGEHEILIALSGLFPDTIEPIRAAFNGLLPQENIRVWCAPGPVMEGHSENDVFREVAEIIREAFFASLQPDVIHICSLFEGYVDDAVTSIGRFDQRTHVSAAFYDLIPLLNPEQYLKPNPRYAQYYQRKIDHLKQASVLLAISESARGEGLAYFSVPGLMVTNVSSAIETRFHPLSIDDNTANQFCQKFNLIRPFILYTGGADERKNLPRLIQAYAALPQGIQEHFQLVFAGRIVTGERYKLNETISACKLKQDNILFTGYVSDEELVQLYNLCELFVFPSWHEGFGLPALEAMACGAPVIGANTSSLPEVIGLNEALFDPLDVTAITARMQEALTNTAFRERLRVHGQQQAKLFSWDTTAKRAIAAWEALPVTAKTTYREASLAESRLLTAVAEKAVGASKASLMTLSASLALNHQSGIERQLLIDISAFSQRDGFNGVHRIVRSYLKWLLQSPPAGFRVEPIYASREEGYRYARRYTQRFLGQSDEELVDTPICWQRGDIFFGLDMQHDVQLVHRACYPKLQRDGVTVKFLVYDLLPIQLVNFFRDSNAKELHEQWLTMIAATDGAICMSRVTSDALVQWMDAAIIPASPTFHSTWVHIGADIEGSVPSSGLPAEARVTLAVIRARPSFLSVSTLEPRKGQQQILDAVQVLWDEGLDLNLILVGQPGWQIETLAEKIHSHPEQGKRLFWLQGISDGYLEQVYAASTCLIAASINEGVGLPLIEAARHGIPIIARDIPVFREVAGTAASYFSCTSATELAREVKDWLDLYRQGQHPQSSGIRWLTWQQSAEKLKDALVRQYRPRRQLLVDISELIQHDAKSGIQRVVRSILTEWLNNPPPDYRIEPVYASAEQGYRYARCFTAAFMNWSSDELVDDLIDYAPGDIFFGLDLQPQVQVAQWEFYQRLRRHGVLTLFTVYDLLPIQLPQFFASGNSEGFTSWLRVVAEGDGAVCISLAVAEELAGWIEKNPSTRLRPFNISWFHLGADVLNTVPSKGLPADTAHVLRELSCRSTFSMVGTLEPRKGHVQTLAAFEQLWQKGTDINLVIVGKQGWLADDLIARLRTHSELNQRLFWLEGISDEYLEKVYAASTCLIAASYGEGFGLPLIEAAQYKLPIIARDIPVFREVSKEHAFYFPNTNDSQALAEAIKEWLSAYTAGRHISSATMPWLTWKESAARLMALLENTQKS